MSQIETKTVRILVLVEDEPDMRLVIRGLLAQDERIEVCGEASNVEGALELARTFDPGLIILDHSIDGEIMGLEAAPMLKEAAPRAKILMFSAFDMGREAAAEPAIDEFLSKAEIARLLPTVQRMLDLH